MRIRASIYRLFRLAVVAGAAVLGYRWLAPLGLGWLVLVIGGAILAAWVALRLRRVRRERRRDERADRWAEALAFPPGRAAAVAELREERARCLSKDPPEHARLTLVLAELLEADGDPGAAIEALDEVSAAELPASLAAVIRHARAVAHVANHQPEAALATLDEHPEPTGERSIDLRIRMMRGLIAADLGDAEEAARIAAEAREEALDDENLRMEARVLAAVALDADDRRDEAIEQMHRLGDDMLDVLVLLGLPRVRGLARDTIMERGVREGDEP